MKVRTAIRIIGAAAIIAVGTIILSGCAASQLGGDSSLANGVRRLGGGMYSVSEMSLLMGDPIVAAAQQCQMDGNKKLVIAGNTTRTGVASGTVYAVTMFRCE
jgi:hypothetical protein